MHKALVDFDLTWTPPNLSKTKLLSSVWSVEEKIAFRKSKAVHEIFPDFLDNAAKRGTLRWVRDEFLCGERNIFIRAIQD